MELSLSFTGADELLEAFARLPDLTGRNMRVAVKEGAVIVQKEARQTHRFRSRTGAVDRSVEVVGGGIAGGASALVFLNRSVTPVGEFIHGGTRPHVIRPRRRTMLRWASSGFSGPMIPGGVGRSGFAFSREIHHPGTKADPFLYQAADRKRGAVEQHIQRAIDRTIQESKA
jgi:hypothetical protein